MCAQIVAPGCGCTRRLIANALAERTRLELYHLYAVRTGPRTTKTELLAEVAAFLLIRGEYDYFTFHSSYFDDGFRWHDGIYDTDYGLPLENAVVAPLDVGADDHSSAPLQPVTYTRRYTRCTVEVVCPSPGADGTCAGSITMKKEREQVPPDILPRLPRQNIPANQSSVASAQLDALQSLPAARQPHRCVFKPDTGYDNYVGGVTKHADSAEICCELCWADQRCVVAVQFGGGCYLKWSNATPVYKPGVTSCATGRDPPQCEFPWNCPLQWHPLEHNEGGASCLDGSNYGFYFRRGANTRRFVVELSGGG